MKKLEQYIHPYWGYILLTVSIKLFAAMAELTVPYLMEIMLDVKVPAGDLNGIYIVGAMMLLCAAFALGGNVLANRMSAISSGKITRTIRHDLFEKLQSLSARQVDELTVASAQSRLTSDTYNINQLLARTQRLGIRAPSLVIGGLIMTMTMDRPLALVLLGMLPIIAIVILWVTKVSMPLYTEQQTVLDRVVRTVQENITGIRVIKALSKTEHEKQRFHTVNSEYTIIDQKAGDITAITNPSTSLALNIGLTLVVLIGAFRVDSGAMKPGVIVSFLQYFTMILNSTMAITRMFVMWFKGAASAKRIAEVMDMPADLVIAPAAEAEPNAPHIEFRDVSFSYTGIGKNIDSLSFRLGHGQTLGILGPTGAGKSTIINLLLRLYDPDSGTVLIDGQDVRTIPYDEFRQKFGVVFQNDFITEGTIADNIRFFRDLSVEDLTRAAEDAQAEFIQEKEGGMDAEVVIRGNNLSGGQKQRLLIARALAARPEILVLDDSSSALDYQTDSRLRQALRKNYRDTTTVVIAQRISSLRHADLILVISDSQVIGAGTHDELMTSCEEYRIIAETQMGEGKEAV